MKGELVEIKKLTDDLIQEMFTLMDMYYDGMLYDNFTNDLEEKDHCILLTDNDGILRGFSTQKQLSFTANERVIHGVFSGDTIIHRDYWGSLELYKAFAKHFIRYGKQFDKYYWFLISKGYKTYKMLPVFFRTFYPDCRTTLPEDEKAIMNAFGHLKYPDEYNERTGVIEYNGQKDKLKTGVADITEKQLKDKHIRFFTDKNPHYYEGNNLVCLACLSEDNLSPAARRLLLGERQ